MKWRREELQSQGCAGGQELNQDQGSGLSAVLQLAALVRYQSAEADIKLLTFPAKAAGSNNQDLLFELFLGGGVVLSIGTGFLVERNFKSPFILQISFSAFI